MSTKLTYTGAEVQGLLDKIEKGDFDNAKTLEGHPASYFAIASEFTSLAESFVTEQGRVSALYSYFNNGSANDALSLGGQLPSYYATALQYEILQQTLTDFKSLFDSMFEKDSDGNIHAKLSLWSSGGITAGGVGSGGSGGGGASYDRLDSWSDYSADKAGYVLSALLGKDLDDRVSALANAGYITASYLAPYALRSEIPSLAGYATQSWVGDNYLSKSGGVITGQGDTRYVQLRLDGELSTVMFQQRGIEKGVVGWWSTIGVRLQNTNGYGLAVTDSNDPIFYWGDNGYVQRILLHSGNYSDYALPITGGTVNGPITATSFIGNLTGNANSATRLLAYKHNGGVYSLVSGVRTDGTLSRDIYDNGRALIYRSQGQGVNAEIATIDSNVASATKLATPRTIWGRWFDGTSSIDGDIFPSSSGCYFNANGISQHSNFGWVRDVLLVDSLGNIAVTGALTSQAIASAGISIGCDASGVASDNYAREINTFANKLYLQYRGGDLDLCGGGGTTYIGGALEGKTANFTSLTAHAITTNSLTIGDITLTYDSGNEALCINGNMYALGGITAGGAGISAYTSLEARVARLEQQLN